MPHIKSNKQYVKSLLTIVKQKHPGFKVDLANTSREQKVDAAVIMHKDGNPHTALEIMVGRPIDLNDPLKLTLTTLEMNPNKTDEALRIFYAAFKE